MSIQIVPFDVGHEEAVLALSMRAWTPVFEKLEQAVSPFVLKAFYPEGWRVRQRADIGHLLHAEGDSAWVALDAGQVVGWVVVRIHPADRMGEIHIIAVDPDKQRRGIAKGLIDHAMAEIRRAGMAMVMVETGDDQGHAPSRATYENAGFQRWPVARYFREL